ncbi:FecCD family ABC transporter permease [Hyphobacterium marinum]|uniref:Iron ABC transporter permease n=1 Tax=Hyphobacterium marinum TaxID=3116574 RepID=A0ABU7LZR8_9PROT|nr:iron ABC transporter permease [Hyphobacterium sp. Y6023]MEE2566505.1 iron ABC transporter permease [Hyphobacterium sp. Y6023]
MKDLRLILLLAMACLAAGLLSVFSTGFPLGDWLAGDRAASMILTELRLPRALTGLIVGAGLGATGAALQGFFRNPLADPGIVGVTSGAGLGAVIALYFGLAGVFAFAVPLAAIAGAGLGATALLLIAGPGARATTLILSGVAVGALANALTALLMNLSPNPWALSEIAYWLMGSLTNASWTEVWIATPLIAAGLCVLAFTRRALDALSLGDDAAASLGHDLDGLRLTVVVGAALSVGGGVAVAGAIGFVGLVVPHLLRPFVQHEPGRLLLPSALGGAALLSLADTTTRALSGSGLPLYLGVATALLGAPFFLWLVRTQSRRAP